MSKSDITPFCADEPGRYAIDRTWVKNGWRYATDGRICVRVPAVGVKDTDQGSGLPFPDMASIITPHPGVGGCAEKWPTGFDKMRRVKCTSAAHDKTCHWCKGTGRCVCPDCDNEHDCSSCDGRGSLTAHMRCDECGETGWLNEIAPLYIGTRLISGVFARKIGTLSNVLYCAAGDLELLQFVADGGLQGAVAPIREKT